VEDIISQPDSETKKRQMEVGTSSEAPRRKGKKPMVWSPRRKPDDNHYTTVHSRGSAHHANTSRMHGEVEIFGPRRGRCSKIP
jgi:hypothetical protein